MKRFLFTLGLLIAISSISFGQLFDDSYELNFDSQFGLQHLTIDTISNPNNIWQIGSPQKTIFINAYSTPNVLVTDTINSYPPNDTSIFIITNVAMGQGFEMPHTVILAGEYFVNSDTLTDYGKIEFSPDNGTTWIDMLNDTVIMDTTNNLYWCWSYYKPVLTGNSNQWKSFWVNLAELGHFYGVQDGDTILYKFTFISDSIQTNKDGLMYDNLHFEDWVEGIDEFENSDKVSIYPNPTNGNVTIESSIINLNISRIEIYNETGILVLNKELNSNTIKLDLPNGVYFVKLIDDKKTYLKKIIIEK